MGMSGGGAGIENFTMSEVLYVGRFAESLNYFLFYFFGGVVISGSSLHREIRGIARFIQFVIAGNSLYGETSCIRRFVNSRSLYREFRYIGNFFISGDSP